MNEAIVQSIRFFVLLFIQLILLHNVQLWGIAFPFIFIFFILFLPLTLNPWLALLLGFFIGVIVDIFSTTYGLHTATCTLLAFVRPFVLQRLTPKIHPDDPAYLNLYSRDLPANAAYLAVMSFTYCTGFFILQHVGTHGLFVTLKWALASATFTFLLLMIYRYLLVSKSDVKRKRI